MKLTLFKACGIILLFSSCLIGQNAPWVAYPEANNQVYGVYHFRKTFDLKKVPDKLNVEVSADNRYNLFVNGKRVSYGPAKGDLKTYKYDIVDIAPFLKSGKNVLAAVVNNAGKDKQMSIFSVQTAFMLRAQKEEYQGLNTDRNWKVFKNESYSPVTYQEMLFDNRWFYGYYACGPGDRVDASKYPWNWEKVDYKDNRWENAEELRFEGKEPWSLVARNIPAMANHEVFPLAIRRSNNVSGYKGFLSGESTLKVLPNTKAEILFDFEDFTMGYPELKVRGGKGSKVKMKFAEALYEGVNLKAHRDSVGSLTMYGVYDIYEPNGGERTFRPLWKRTARYVSLEIETQNELLEITGLKLEYSGYPYENMATFESDDAITNEIFEMSQRTLEMCSGETYYDTPYYEQLSYGGDNRPIGHISMFNTTDDRLFKEVMRLYSQSVNTQTGLMKSAYPSRFDFDQGTWSLAWIQSLNDYYNLRADAEYVRQFEGAIDNVLSYYRRHTDKQLNILNEINVKNFLDWSISKGNIPRMNENGVFKHNIMLTTYYILTLNSVVELYENLGLTVKAKTYRAEADLLKKGVRESSYNSDLGLFRDEMNKEIYSQHTNILAILADVIPKNQQEDMLKRVLSYQNFDEMASSYFSFYLFKAMEKTKRGDLLLSSMTPWKKYIDKGYTTTGETGFASHDRSDCHAWSAHPAYFFMSLVAGIQSASIGFDEITITPNLGSLKELKVTLPNPIGLIKAEYKMVKGTLKAEINLPEGIKGDFKYNGFAQELKPGINHLEVSL